MEPLVHFVVLGPLQVRLGASTKVIAGRRERTLLAGLLLTPGEPVEAERLAGLLWPVKGPRDAGMRCGPT